MRKHLQLKAWILLLLFLSEIFSPIHLMAWGSGPSQPEMAAFTPIGTTEMVDPFTGDFTYNIPLMDVEGYPINIAYNSGVTMEQEASWVGLGWNLNVGTINRSVRGLPDDFKGDAVQTTTSMKPMKITKIGLGRGVELSGSEALLKLTASKGLSFIHNNYKGFGISFDNSIGASFPLGPMSAKAKTGLTLNSLDGASVNSSLGLTIGKSVGDNGSLSFGGNMGTGYNTRTGQTTLTLGTTAGYKGKGKIEKDNGDGTTTEVEKEYSLKSPSATASFLPIGMNTYTPYPSVKLKTTTHSFSASVGSEAWTVHPNYTLNGSRTTQEVETKTTNVGAYGYIYSEKANNRSLKDFNRDKSVQLNKTTTNLSPVNFTYDVFSVSGQGVSGMFRPFRNDIGFVNDPLIAYNSSSSQSFGGEVGLGGYFHGGINYDEVNVSSSFGPWVSGNGANNLKFRSKPVGSNFENVYFKAAGDKAESDLSYFNSIGGYDAVAFQLHGHSTAAALYKEKGGVLAYLPDRVNAERVSRSKLFTVLTAAEARFSGLQKTIFSHKGLFYGYTPNQYTRIDRVDGTVRKAHHISEITQTNPDGERFVFGIPAYNITKKEVTYTTDKNSANADGRITQNPLENNPNNSAGRDGYYSSTTTPSYAHSFLLTAKLSPDYQDVTGNGVSEDDIGTAHEFDYTRTSSSYKWRTPYKDDNFMEGFKSSDLDQKGSYTYGEKELWYIHTIRSKNQVAEFHISPRKDALGVAGEGGDQPQNPGDSDKSYKLDSLVLYNKYDRISNGPSAEPIKKVIFTYDYSLCQKVQNNIEADSGKLTLKKIEITYGHDNIGAKSPYVFTYSSFNPDYNPTSINRWGDYKQSGGNPDNMKNGDYPYVLQNNPALANQWASAWNLEEIQTPSGAVISVDYESDDYAYVQNKRAMQMYPIIGAGTGTAHTTSGTLYNNNFLYFERPDSVPDDLNATDLRKLFLGKDGKMDNMYFKFRTSIGTATQEYATGFVRAINLGYCNNRNYLYVQLAHESPNAISRTAWGNFRQNLFEVLYRQPNVKDTGLESLLKGIAANIADITQMFVGVEDHLQSRQIANSFTKQQSFVRLYNATGFKKGGGSRVKQVVLNDSWNSMSGEGENALYGQTYQYTTTNEDGLRISSGVASYEPMVGNDENPFRQPIPYTAVAAKGHIPSIEAYIEEPLGETFFPSANVGYSKVTVKNIHYNRGKTTNSITEHQFYTAKDFPAIVSQTRIQKNDNPATGATFTFPFSNTTKHSKFSASQGYTILLNDMHGKPKSEVQYLYVLVDKGNGKSAEVKKKIGGAIYNYKVKDSAKGKLLDNEVEVISNQGFVETKLLGMDYDIAVDSRRSYTSSSSSSNKMNGDVIPGLFAIPFPIPTFYYNIITDIEEAKTVAVTKVIQMYGLLESVETFTDQYATTSYNRIYDGATGEVILTESIDEHNQNSFEFTIPAHAMHSQERMGPAYENIGLEAAIQLQTDSNCITASDSYINNGYLRHGDEVMIYPNQKKAFDENTNVSGIAEQPYRAWVDISSIYGQKDPLRSNGCNYSYDQSEASSGMVRFHTRLDYSMCNDSTINFIQPENGHVTRIYHLKDSVADFINEWTELHRDSTYQGVFKDSGPNSLCSNFSSGAGRLPTIFNSTITGYTQIRRLDTLAIDELFDLSDPIYVIGGGYYTMSNTSDCNSSVTVNPITDHDFYAPQEINIPDLNSYIPSGASQSSSGPQSGDQVSNVYAIAKYEDRFDRYFQFNQVFLKHSTKYDRVGGVCTTIEDEWYNVEWISPCSPLPYLHSTIIPNVNITGCPIIPDDKYEVYNSNSHLNETYLGVPTPFVSYKPANTNKCPKTYRLIDREGNYISGLSDDDTLEIIRSGNRNMLSSNSGTIISSTNPMKIDASQGNRFEGIKSAADGLRIYQAHSKSYKDEFSVDNPYYYDLSLISSDTIEVKNKFLRGLDGNFRPNASYRYVSSRYQTNGIEASKDGYMEVLPSLWRVETFPCDYRMQHPDYTVVGGQSSGWQLVERYTAYSPDGIPTNSMNNLDIPSMATKNYKGQLEVVGSNAMAKNVLVDNYENYHFKQEGFAHPYHYFRSFQAEDVVSNTSMGPGIGIYTYNDDEVHYGQIYHGEKDSLGVIFHGIAHTGDYSIFVRNFETASQFVELYYVEQKIKEIEEYALGDEIFNDPNDSLRIYLTGKEKARDTFMVNLSPYIKGDILNYSYIGWTPPNPFQRTVDHLNYFTINDTTKPNSSFIDSGKYVFSIWAKELTDSKFNFLEDYDSYWDDEELKIVIKTETDTVELYPSGEEIDGWRKIEGTFSCMDSSKVQVSMWGGFWGAFFDDMRIQPHNSVVNTYIYDFYTGRLKAALDENNFATFYEYDKAGIPSQVKKETNSGILTVSESRQSNRKRP